MEITPSCVPLNTASQPSAGQSGSRSAAAGGGRSALCAGLFVRYPLIFFLDFLAEERSLRTILLDQGAFGRLPGAVPSNKTPPLWTCQGQGCVAGPRLGAPRI